MGRLPFQELAGRLSQRLGGSGVGNLFRRLYWRMVFRGEKLPAGIVLYADGRIDRTPGFYRVRMRVA